MKLFRNYCPNWVRKRFNVGIRIKSIHGILIHGFRNNLFSLTISVHRIEWNRLILLSLQYFVDDTIG